MWGGRKIIENTHSREIRDNEVLRSKLQSRFTFYISTAFRSLLNSDGSRS